MLVIYVRRENGTYVIGATADDSRSVATAALKLADAGQLDAARTWLNWFRDAVGPRKGEEPLDTISPFAGLWPKEKPAATADEIRVAAATMLGADTGAPILLAARDAASDERKEWIDSALLDIYFTAHQWAKTLEVADRLAKAHPQSEVVFTRRSSALMNVGDLAGAEAAAKKRLDTLPHDRHAYEMLYAVAARRKDYAAAAAQIAHTIDELTPTDADYDTAAWIALFTASDYDKAIENAQKATAGQMTRSKSRYFHTLATLYAVTGKTVEAREALLKSMDARNADAPNASDWLVLGLIAENYGVRDFAASAYKRVEPPAIETPVSTFAFAQRRLAALK